MSDKINIDKNVPQPKLKIKYPFEEMKVGDSFFVSEKYNSVAVSAIRYKKLHAEFNFTLRKEGKGFRLWRIPLTQP